MRDEEISVEEMLIMELDEEEMKYIASEYRLDIGESPADDRISRAPIVISSEHRELMTSIKDAGRREATFSPPLYINVDDQNNSVFPNL